VGRFVRIAGLPLADRLLSWHSFFAFERILRPDLTTTVDPVQWNRDLTATMRGTPLARILHHNFETYLAHDLLVKSDRCSMWVGLELRSPLLDTKLIEKVARVPDRMWRRGRVRKWAFKQAFADLVPPEILHRQKMGFGLPMGSWFRGKLRPLLLDHLTGSARLFDYLDRSVVEGLVSRHLSGEVDEALRLWLLLTFESWLRNGLTPRTTRRASILHEGRAE
jgi:asparagine synthase (glutamine-hydrolysing)